jgi:hypothetical protein
MLRCLVLGLILGTFAISIAPALSSKTLQCTLDVAFNTGIPCCFASSISHMIGNTSLMACESAMYSASVVDKAISVYIFDNQCMGHPAYVMMYPILDLAVLGSDDAVLIFHSEACAASTQHSTPS